VPIHKVHEMRAAGHGPSAIANALKISRMSVHRALKAPVPEPKNRSSRFAWTDDQVVIDAAEE
jgi:hypothetical protein